MPSASKPPKHGPARHQLSPHNFETHTDVKVETSRLSASLVEPEVLDSSRRGMPDHARPGKQSPSRGWPEF